VAKAACPRVTATEFSPAFSRRVDLFSTPSASNGANCSSYSVDDSLYDPSLALGVLNRSWSSFPDTLSSRCNSSRP